MSPDLTAPPAERTRAVFHVKHRQSAPAARRLAITWLLFPLIALALLQTACAQSTPPEGWAAPVSDGTRIYAQLDRGVLWAFTLTDSSVQRIWRYPADTDKTKFDAIYATPIISGSVIYVVSHEGDVVALRTNDGRPLDAWGDVPVSLAERVVATPVFDGSRLLVATEVGNLFAINGADGSVNHLSAFDGRVWSALAAAGTTVYLGNMDDRLVAAVDATSGTVLWEQPLVGAAVSDLQLADGELVVGSLDHALHGLNVHANGAEDWRFEGDGWFMSAPLADGDVVYAATLRGSVYAIDVTSGTARWTFHEDKMSFRAQPALVGDTVVMVDRTGEIFGLSRMDGSVRWRQTIESVTIDANPLTIADDVLLITTKGDLIRIAADGTTRRIAAAS